MLSIVIAGLKTLSCVKRSKLTIFSLEPQGHVIDHALKCVKTMDSHYWTRRKVKFSFIIFLTLTRCKRNPIGMALNVKLIHCYLLFSASASPSPSLNCNTKNIRNNFASLQAVLQSKYYQSLFRCKIGSVAHC